MRAVFEFLRVIGNSESTVLITGESGTGKEVTATLIHQSSRRKHQPFVAVSCALFSETLIESELFGHDAWRVHRRDQGSPRPLRAGGPRHNFSRRHRRRSAVDAGQAAASAAEPDD
jgi:ABC-type dipeptide/oligopeptide/nickel transport system ATPase component